MRTAILLASNLVLITLWGCASHAAMPAPGGGQISPFVYQHHVTKNGWVHKPLPLINGWPARPTGITSDGHHMWVAAGGGSGTGYGVLDEVLMNGRVKTFSLSVVPSAIAYGSDANLWVSSFGAGSPSIIAQVTPAGIEKDFMVSQQEVYITDLIVGPDQALWFTMCVPGYASGGIGRIDTQGTITTYPGPCAWTMTVGSDGNLWYSGQGQNLYVMDTQGNQLATYPTGDQSVARMVLGPDGAIYAGATGTNCFELLRVTMQGQVTHFPDCQDGSLQSLTVGPDGNIWTLAYRNWSSRLLKFDVQKQTFTMIAKTPDKDGKGLVLGPDRNLWAIAYMNNGVDAFVYMTMTIAPSALNVPIGQSSSVSVTEANYSGPWTAVSSDLKVATVQASSQDGTFQVSAVGPGKCNIVVYDSMYNSIAARLTAQ